MRTNGRILGAFVALALVGSAAPATADDAFNIDEQRHLFELGIYAGVIIPSKGHELHEWPTVPQQHFKDAAFDIGGRLGYLPVPYFGFEIEGGAMPTKTETTDVSATLWHFRGHLLAQYPARVAPFLVLGGGVIGVSSGTDAVGNDADAMFHWGLGLKAYATKWLALRLDGRHIVGSQIGGEDKFTSHFEILAGLSAVLGWKDSEPRDSDGDGLTDDKDKCPDQPAKTPDGCPIGDTDGDGLTDDKDKCPKEPASTPDGCPIGDSDGDGLTDDKDKCPNEAAKTPDGCPIRDSDGDGILDDKDMCKDQPENKNGYQDEDGCPDEIPQQIKRFTGAIKGIYFDFGKATIRKASYPTLNAAVKVLTDYPDLKLIIRGHTDSRGTRERNMQLSQERADSVKSYLTGKGVDESRLTTEGLGPDEPVADNKTDKGRQQNRRIEFKLPISQ